MRIKRLSLSLGLIVCALTSPGRGAESNADTSEALLKANNIGKAYLENRRSQAAIEAFKKAAELAPESPAVRRNLARAYMLERAPKSALAQLTQCQQLENQHAATAYLIGLVHVNQSKFKPAIPHLEEAVRLAPKNDTLRFQLANAYQHANRHAAAREQLNAVVRLNPRHASAHFKLAAYARRDGDNGRFKSLLETFQRLKKLNPRQSSSPRALQQCIFTEPEVIADVKNAPSSGLEVRFVDATPEFFPASVANRSVAAEVLEIDKNGKYTLVSLDQNGQVSLSKLDANGNFVATRLNYLVQDDESISFCHAANIHDPMTRSNESSVEAYRNDLLMTTDSGLRLLQQTAGPRFEDITKTSGLDNAEAPNFDCVDYDHDGDLDLLTVQDKGVALWRNNGDGTFAEMTQAAGLNVTGRVRDVASGDLNRDGAVDLIICRGTGSTLVFENQRAGRFRRRSAPSDAWPSAIKIVVDDLDHDGHPDAVLLQEDGIVTISENQGRRSRIPLNGFDPNDLLLFDYDNDGRRDICVTGTADNDSQTGSIKVWRNRAPHQWIDVSEALELDSLRSPPIHQLHAADLDNDGDSDLFGLRRSGGLRFLKNLGGNRHHQLKIRLVGTKTNPNGINAAIEVRAGAFTTSHMVKEVASEIGLGERTKCDYVRTLWTNGIRDNQINLSLQSTPLIIQEKNVAAGSCPYLYAWNGETFEFVTDLLGGAPIGLSITREATMPADPEEIVRIGDTAIFRPRNGDYELEVTEELREVLYLDQAKLLVVDHPPEVEVHSTDKLRAPPFPRSQVWALSPVGKPQRAVDHNGKSWKEQLLQIDGDFAVPGTALPPPYRGMCHPWSLRLDFGPLPSDRPLVLALTGWLQYGDASANIAASQNKALKVIPPTLEARGRKGDWETLDVTVGMPAGKTKTILVDLNEQLPTDAVELRLKSSFEIRWDRIALFQSVPLPKRNRHHLAPSSAQLDWRGFSEMRRKGPEHPPTPDYDSVSARPPWGLTPQGWCTRYGDVLPLIERRDSRLAILNGGDALRLRFDGSELPNQEQGQARTFFFYSVGWDKDADYNVIGGTHVKPLPVESASDWQVQYNTRWVPFNRFRTPTK